MREKVPVIVIEIGSARQESFARVEADGNQALLVGPEYEVGYLPSVGEIIYINPDSTIPPLNT